MVKLQQIADSRVLTSDDAGSAKCITKKMSKCKTVVLIKIEVDVPCCSWKGRDSLSPTISVCQLLAHFITVVTSNAFNWRHTLSYVLAGIDHTCSVVAVIVNLKFHSQNLKLL